MTKIYTALNKEEEIIVKDSHKSENNFAVSNLQQIENLDFLKNMVDKTIFLLYNKLESKKKRADLIEISTLDGFRHTWLW
jgi:hypothetical protein